jgi:hypothetical protein
MTLGCTRTEPHDCCPQHCKLCTHWDEVRGDCELEERVRRPMCTRREPAPAAGYGRPWQLFAG